MYGTSRSKVGKMKLKLSNCNNSAEPGLLQYKVVDNKTKKCNQNHEAILMMTLLQV